VARAARTRRATSPASRRGRVDAPGAESEARTPGRKLQLARDPAILRPRYFSSIPDTASLLRRRVETYKLSARFALVSPLIIQGVPRGTCVRHRPWRCQVREHWALGRPMLSREHAPEGDDAPINVVYNWKATLTK
jgi:hypothetical protein